MLVLLLSMLAQLPTSGPLLISFRNDKPVDDIANYQRQRTEEVSQLLKSAVSAVEGKDYAVATTAITKLGLMRASEAVPFLVEHFDYSPPRPRFVSRVRNLSEARPCIFALGQIGGLAHDALLKRLALDSFATQENVRLTSIVLKMSLGCDDAIAVLRARAVGEKDASIAARLRELADWIDKRERKTTYN